ncbi:hypothetical protein [Rhodococcus sp. SJ-2]
MSTDFTPELIARPGTRQRQKAAPRRTAEQRAAEYFKVSTADHEMAILHDDGVYRHIRCAQPGTGIWSWNLVTWPGHLAISGDLESYTFSREHDMFGFFQIHGAGINPHYWSEKITNYDAQRGTRKFCSEKAKAVVVREFLEQRHYRSGDTADAFRDLRINVLDEIDNYDQSLFYNAVDSWSYDDYLFHDTYEWDVKDYDDHFLYACHAIAWGIAKYRQVVQP